MGSKPMPTFQLMLVMMAALIVDGATSGIVVLTMHVPHSENDVGRTDKPIPGNGTYLASSSKYYTARHGYHHVLIQEEYPLFNHSCPWNLASTFFTAARTLLPYYDWVFYHQYDSVFINHDLPLTSFTERIPSQAHFVLSAQWQYIINDVSMLIRNSQQGRDMLQRLIDLQVDMHTCAAPGMGVLNTFFLHQLNGTMVRGHRILYNGECEQICKEQNVSHDFKGTFDIRPLYQCLKNWYVVFGVTNWHVREVKIPGIWIIPGNDDVILRSGLPTIGDDISSFGNGPPQYHYDFFLPGPYKLGQNLLFGNITETPEFGARFATSLVLHTGSGGRALEPHMLAQEMSRLYPIMTPLRLVDFRRIRDIYRRTFVLNVSKYRLRRRGLFVRPRV